MQPVSSDKAALATLVLQSSNQAAAVIIDDTTKEAAATCATHPASRIPHPASRILHSTENAQHADLTKEVEYLRSRIKNMEEDRNTLCALPFATATSTFCN